MASQGAYWSLTQLHIGEGRGRPWMSRLAQCKFLRASVASLRVPWQCFEGVLAPPPSTGTPSKFCPHLRLEPKIFGFFPYRLFLSWFPPFQPRTANARLSRSEMTEEQGFIYLFIYLCVWSLTNPLRLKKILTTTVQAVLDLASFIKIHFV